MDVPWSPARSTYPVGAWASWLVICLGWGLTYHWMSEGAKWNALAFVAVRHTAGGVLLLGASYLHGERERLGVRTIGRLIVVGVLMWTVGNGLLIWSLRPGGLDEGPAAIVVATIPLWTGLIVRLRKPGHVLSIRFWIPVVIGLIGTFVMIFQNHHSAPWRPVAGLTAGVIAWSLGSVILKRTHGNDADFRSAGIQMLAGGSLLAIACLVVPAGASTASSSHFTASTALSLVLTIIVGSALCPWCYARAVKALPVTVVSLHAYLNPIVAVADGAVMDGTALAPHAIAGGVIVLLSVALAGRAEAYDDV